MSNLNGMVASQAAEYWRLLDSWLIKCRHSISKAEKAIRLTGWSAEANELSSNKALA